MSHITIIIDQATEARIRQAAHELGRPIEELACLAIAEAAHAYFARTPERDPARHMGVLHPLLFTPEAVAPGVPASERESATLKGGAEMEPAL